MRPTVLLIILTLLSVSFAHAQSSSDQLTIVTATASATPTLSVTNTPTATPTPTWITEISEVHGIGMPSARLIVQVVGRSGQQVRLATLTQELNVARTGQKPELGPDKVEFAGLTPGPYIVEPLNLGVDLRLDLKENIETTLIFRSARITPTASATADQPTATAAIKFLPLATATASATPTPSATPTAPPTATASVTSQPTATPAPRWMGIIKERRPRATNGSAIQVTMVGLSQFPLRLTGEGVDQRCVTGNDLPQADSCQFTNLAPGLYQLSPERVDASLVVQLGEREQVRVLYDLQSWPTGVVGWQATVIENFNTPYPSAQAVSEIRVIVDGLAGQLITLQASDQSMQRCIVAPQGNGTLGCQFVGLSAGVYRVAAQHTDSEVTLFADGEHAATIEFAPSARTYRREGVARVGQGALPQPPTATAAPTRVVIYPTFTPLPTATATPVLAWQARIVQVQDGVAGTIGVRAAGFKDHPVVLRSGGWQSPPQPTGTKPELGAYSTEFGGLAQGTYEVELVGLATIQVDLGPDQFVLVEFWYGLVE